MDQDLRRAMGKWRLLAKIFGMKGADRRMTGGVYVAVVQEVILFGSKAWVTTPQLEKSLEGFHHWEVWRMAGMGPKIQWDGTWVYTPIEAALTMVGL